MTITQLDRLIDEQNRIFNRMQEIQAGAEKEGRDWTAEERTNWDEANSRIEVVSADIVRLDKMAEMTKVDRSGVADTGGPADSPDDIAAKRAEAYDKAFKTFVRGGMDSLTSEQRNTLIEHRASPQSIGVPADGGYLVPPGYRAEMTESLKAYGGLINLANVITTSTGQPLQWPTNDDTGNVGAILSENTQITELGVTIGTRAIGAYTYTSKLIRVSLQLLQDSAFNLDSWLPKKMGQRIGRAVAQDLITGTGTGMPTGILPGAASGTTTTAAALNTGSAANDALIFDALVNLEHSVDPAYRSSSPANDPLHGPGACRFLFNDQTLARLRKVKDSQNRPLWLPVPTAGVPATLNGNPYTIDQGMPGVGGSYAAAQKPVLFGNFHEGFVVRQTLDTQAVRLTERYADFLQVGFFGFMRIDATPDDAAAVKALVLT